MSTITASLRMNELSALVGEAHVVEAPAKLKEFAVDAVAPAISVTPSSVDEVSAVLKYAHERDLVVVPAGGFVHQDIGNSPAAIDILLRTDRLTGIEHYDSGDLTIGVGAGATIGEIQRLVRDQRQMFPLDIAHSDRATLGGAMAIAAHGPMKHAFGGLREFCIGVRFVTADGTYAKGGGRVVKNVAGFDLMKLMIGSFGTLGVITSASFKLFPLPSATRTFIGEFVKLEDAIAFRDNVMDSPLSPMCLELLSPRALNSTAWTVAVRAGGSETVLARYASELGSRVTRTIDGEQEQTFWTAVELLSENSPVVLRLSVPPQSAGDAISSTDRIANEIGLGYTAWGRIGIGSLFVGLEGGMAESYVGMVARLRGALPRDASAVVARCPSMLKADINIWGQTPTNLNAMTAAKRALNPKNNLNRGRFLL